LIAGFALLFIPDRAGLLGKTLVLAVSILAFVMALRIFSLGQIEYSWHILQIDNFRLDLLLATSSLNRFILLFAMGFGLLISLYSLKADPTRNLNIYCGSLLMAIGGSAGILLTNHLVFLLIFWEIVTVSLYLLITTGGEKCKFAATKSFAMIGASDGALLLGIAMVWSLSGTFVISEISVTTDTAVPITAFLLLMLAAITKAGAMPLHTWIPTSGESAPASVMAVLPAALDKLLGIYLLVITVNGIFVLQSGVLSFILAFIGAATIIIAVMVAMVQHNVKKLLSYHAISQVGYMILGIATMTPIGIAGGVFHMLNHAIYKCCLFLCGGAVEQAAGTAELDQLGGLGRKMPWTFAACLIGALSISGVPPLNGFASKWMVYQGIVNMGAAENAPAASAVWPLWLFAAMFGSALTLASFVKVLHSIFLSRLPSDKQHVKEVPVLMIIPMGVLALLCIVFGVFYHIPLNMFIYPALGIDPATASPVMGVWNSVLATSLLLAGLLLAGVILMIGLRAAKTRRVRTWSCGEIIENDKMIVPGTHFYKTISSMNGLKQLYDTQEKGFYDPYNWGAKVGLAFTHFLKWLHCGLLPMYLTWVTLGLLAILYVICKIW
jgi:formate hydrogenlyase subunit 3/multisubunit Na+/H+ antiporter MnhD subunit